MNTKLYTFSELTKTLEKYWEENALQVIPRWTFRKIGIKVTKDEKISNPCVLHRIQFQILETLVEGKYPLFEIDTEYSVISFRTFDTINDIYKKIYSDSPQEIGLVLPDLISIKTFTQDTVFFWLY